MKKNDVDEILIQFDQFFEFLMLDEAGLEKKRQDLVKAGAIEKVNGQERVLLRKCANWVFDELDLLRMKVMATRSHDDILDYAFASLGYLRVWFYFLACLGPSRDTSGEALPINGLRSAMKSALDDYHKIYEHLHTALKATLEINISANTKE